MLFLTIAMAQVAPPVVNGDLTDAYEEVPLLYITDSSGRAAAICTGSLVAEEWILTAAHCVTDSPGFTIAHIYAYFGSGMRDIFADAEADDWFAHPDYNGQGYDDIALIHLSTPISDIPLMQLASEAVGRSDSGKDFRVVGWGATSDNDNGTNPAKRMADVPLTDYDYKLMMTFDSKDDQNACHGDSGGPVLRLYDDGTYAEAGIVNFAYGNWGADCEGNGLASARVDFYLEWIAQYLTPEIHGQRGSGGAVVDALDPLDQQASEVLEPLSAPTRPAALGENYESRCGGCASAADGSWAALLGISVLVRRRLIR